MNAMLEDYSRLINVKLMLKARVAEITLSVMNDSETEKLHELGDVSWRESRCARHTFHLKGLSRLAISTGSEELPSEIAAVRSPDSKFFSFTASLFEESDIFEWNCFPPENSIASRPFGGARWSLPLVEADPEAQCYMELFKHRMNALWTIGFWFQTFQIDSFETVSVDEFLSQYPKRIGLKVP